MKLSAVRLFVDDLERARRFYGRTLGLEETVALPEAGFCTFASAGLHVVVERVSPQVEEHLVGRFTGISFAVDDLGREVERLQAEGVEFTLLPERQAWGGWLATFRDPAGNELQLAMYPQEPQR